jgi:energy-coupling factor transporter ATP-binding protein EcfA2
MVASETLAKLRRVILETLRVQHGGQESIPYVDVGHALSDIGARQNHAVFGRRGCGKTLLLHHSAKSLPHEIRRVYLNCEDFKTHSFPNVLIEILDTVFKKLEDKRSTWFGRKRKLKQLIVDIRGELQRLRAQEDECETSVRETSEQESSRTGSGNASAELKGKRGALTLAFGRLALFKRRDAVEREYTQHDNKSRRLNALLPALKEKLRSFFDLSSEVKAVFLEIDDFYHLRRVDQPHVMDYVHRLCKDLPLYFKVATLRHASVLYADRHGQPTGAQARHDYQPIDVDFTLENVTKTEKQFHQILYEYGREASLSQPESDSLFKGEGFRRLVLAGGGVPRDCLSLFLEVLDNVVSTDGRIGKDDVRFLSLETLVLPPNEWVNS